MAQWWKPQKVFENADVYVIGGGSSLRNFDFDFLRNQKAIGCNGAFRLGPVVADVCIFGDSGFFDHFEHELKGYYKAGGTVVTLQPRICQTAGEWVRKMKRQTKGLGHGDTLAWNGNTGAAAINLALIMGAARVLLLGFDMALDSEGRPNWHDRLIEKPNGNVYDRFIRGFGPEFIRDWVVKFGHAPIINLNPDSKLDAFPKRDWREFLLKGEINGLRRETA